jgi:hypothetical protein
VLLNEYLAQLTYLWGQLRKRPMTVAQMAHHIVELTTRFVDEHPAYYAVVDAPVPYHRTPQLSPSQKSS